MLKTAFDWLRRDRRRDPRLPMDDAALLARYAASGDEPALRAALVPALRSTRLRAFAQDGRFPQLQAFLPVALGDPALLAEDLLVMTRLCELARRVGVQAEGAARLHPILLTVAAGRIDWLSEGLSFLDGAIDEAAFGALIDELAQVEDLLPLAARYGRAQPDRGAPAAVLLAAIAAGSADPALFAEAETELGVDGLTEVLRADTEALASLGLGLAGWHQSVDPVSSLKLAVTVGDAAAVADYLPQVEDPEVRALGLRALGSPDALDEVFEVLAGEAGVRALRFPLGPLPTLFAAINAQRGATSDFGPLVSVVLTARDPDPALLSLAINSILDQSHGNTELLLVDDGSAEPAVLEAVATQDYRIRLLRGERNTGPYAARNRAIAEARGEFIAIQDADDVSHPDRIARQVTAFADPAVMACAAGAMRFDAAGRLQIAHDGRLFGDGTMSTTFRRSVFDQLGPFAAVRSRGDVEYRERIRRTLGEEALATIACPLVFCGSSPRSLSNVVQRDSGWALRDLRRNFMLLEWRIEDGIGRPVGPLVVPWPLRP